MLYDIAGDADKFPYKNYGLVRPHFQITVT